VDDLAGNEEEPTKPNQTPSKPGAQPETTAPKIQPEDLQLKKAIEILREKPAASAPRGA